MAKDHIKMCGAARKNQGATQVSSLTLLVRKEGHLRTGGRCVRKEGRGGRVGGMEGGQTEGGKERAPIN